MSSDIASTSLRKFSACLVWSDCSSMRDSLVTPSTSRAMSAPNSALDVVERRDRVLDRVVQQAGDDRGGVELHPGEDAGDLDRVREIGVARGAQLRAMRLHRIDIGAVERVLVRLRIVGLDPLDQLELPHHGAAACVLQRRRDAVFAARQFTRQTGPPSGSAALARRGASRLLLAAELLVDFLLDLGSDLFLGAGSSPSSLSSSTVSRSSSSSSSTASSSISSSPITEPVGSATPNSVDLELRVLLGLVDLDVLLHALDQRILQVSSGTVSSAISRSATTGFLSLSRSSVSGAPDGDVARPLRREQHQLEAVRHLDDAIFDGNARHSPILHSPVECPEYMGALAVRTTSVPPQGSASCARRRAGCRPLDPCRATRLYESVPPGRMAEWLCNGLQIRVQRFDSASGLHRGPLAGCLWQLSRRSAIVRRGRISKSASDR